MIKEGLNPYQAQAKRINFIGKAVAEGVLGKIRTNERNQNIALVYYLNEQATTESVAKNFPKPSGEPLSHVRISQIRRKFLVECKKHVSPELSASYPLWELLIGKIPLSETNAQVARDVAAGTDLREIRRKLPPSRLDKAREVLGKRGIVVPKQNSAYAGFAEKVEAENNYQKLQTILDSFPSESLLSYINNHRKDKKKTLIALSPVLRKAGFYFGHGSLKLFAQKIRENHVPIRLIEAKQKTRRKYNKTHYIVYSRHEEEIARALKNDPDLQRFRENPVQLASGIFDRKRYQELQSANPRP